MVFPYREGECVAGRARGLEAGGAGGLTSVSRQVHLQVWLAGPRRRGRVPPPHLLLGRLLHLLVIVVPAGSRAGVRDCRAGPGQARPGVVAAAAQGGAVPSDLVPSDMVHEAVVHVQPPPRLAAVPRPGMRPRLHQEPGTQSRRRLDGPNNSHPPTEVRAAPRSASGPAS